MSGKAAVKLVDGFMIRNTLHEGFGSIHRHGTELSSFGNRFYIPEREIWVDHIYAKSGEVEYLLDMDEKGDRYLEEHPEGDYRAHLKTFCEKGTAPDFYRAKVEINGLAVAKVDGAIIRKYFDPEFIMGGHEFVYDYVPKGEIWLDAWLDEREFPYILIHEQVERKFMEDGMSYDDAHEYANAAEKALRAKDGVGNYPGYENYTWRGKSNEEILKHYYV